MIRASDLIGVSYDTSVDGIPFDDQNALVGYGVDLKTGSPMETSPFKDEAKEVIDNDGVTAHIETQYEGVSNSTQKDKLLSAMSSVGGTYANFGAKANMAFVRKDSSSDLRVEVYILSAYRSKQATKMGKERLDVTDFTDEAKKLLYRDSKGKYYVTKLFIEKYGTHFVKRAQNGATLIGCLTFDAETDSTRQQLESGLAGTVLGFGELEGALKRTTTTQGEKLVINFNSTIDGLTSVSNDDNSILNFSTLNKTEALKNLNTMGEQFKKKVEENEEKIISARKAIALRLAQGRVEGDALKEGDILRVPDVFSAVLNTNCQPWSHVAGVNYEVKFDYNRIVKKLDAALTNQRFNYAAKCLLVMCEKSNLCRLMFAQLMANKSNVVLPFAYAFHQLVTQVRDGRHQGAVVKIFGEDIANLVASKGRRQEQQFTLECETESEGGVKSLKTVYVNRKPHHSSSKFMTVKENAKVQKSLCSPEMTDCGKSVEFLFKTKFKDEEDGKEHYMFRSPDEHKEGYSDIKATKCAPRRQRKFYISAAIKGPIFFNVNNEDQKGTKFESLITNPLIVRELAYLKRREEARRLQHRNISDEARLLDESSEAELVSDNDRSNYRYVRRRDSWYVTGHEPGAEGIDGSSPGQKHPNMFFTLKDSGRTLINSTDLVKERKGLFSIFTKFSKSKATVLEAAKEELTMPDNSHFRIKQQTG